MARNQISEGLAAFNISAYQHHDRSSLYHSGTLQINKHFYPGAMVDFSLAGALFVTDTDAHEADGAICLLEVRDIIPETTRSLSGIVIHTEHKVLVIKFTSLSEMQYSALSRAHAASDFAPQLLWRGVAGLVKSIPADMAAQIRSPGFERIPNARSVPSRRQTDRRQPGVRRSHI